ncbi:Pvc16 family protein [Arthrobacter sp. GCM10027362]|uniref:Pvc16 family protein n=1 Tax=Arthrobacter sp. GCM10027362 TaxID=3273379 RepID=UPI003635E457
MSASTAIGMVSTSLRNLLLAEMRLNPSVDVTVLAPDETGSGRRINLFLYRIEENEYLANQDALAEAGNRLVPPPLSLSLLYLMTVYAPNDAVGGNVTAHEILGEAMRVFRQHSPIPRGHLAPGLAGAREDLRIVARNLDAEELSRIWATFSQPFRLSVPYQVSTVQLDAVPQAPLPMPARVRTIGVPRVLQPAAPPSILAMSPTRGPGGTSLTFTGEHLAGWRVAATIGGRRIVDAAASGDTVAAVVPADLGAGHYEVRVDIPMAFRRTFLFEVAP